jgi:hypothetical protein
MNTLYSYYQNYAFSIGTTVKPGSQVNYMNRKLKARSTAIKKIELRAVESKLKLKKHSTLFLSTKQTKITLSVRKCMMDNTLTALYTIKSKGTQVHCT